jgi:transcription elongation factor GreA
MEDEQFVLTRQGYERLQAELTEREAEQEERRENLEEYEDIDRQNGEEEAADFELRTSKEAADERVGHLKFVLERAQVIDEDPDPQRINEGDRVIAWDLQARQEQTFNLVNGEEIGTLENGVATDSPVGKALLGHRVGDVIEVAVPDGWSRYMVRRLERFEEKNSGA